MDAVLFAASTRTLLPAWPNQPAEAQFQKKKREKSYKR